MVRTLKGKGLMENNLREVLSGKKALVVRPFTRFKQAFIGLTGER